MDLAQLTTKTNLKMLFENNALQGSPQAVAQDWAGSVCHAMEKQVFARAGVKLFLLPVAMATGAERSLYPASTPHGQCCTAPKDRAARQADTQTHITSLPKIKYLLSCRPTQPKLRLLTITIHIFIKLNAEAGLLSTHRRCLWS